THREGLLKRGLSDDQIDQLGYKSTPPPYLCQSYKERLMKQGCAVQGVPGFYMNDSGRWTVKFYKRTAGLLVPIKDENEDEEKEGIWLSSINKHMGVTSGSSVHFVGDPFARVVYVTEGALKADVAHFLMNRSFAAVAGVNNLGQLDPIFALLSQNGTREIIEAHDMDKYRNEMIEKGASRIYIMASKYRMSSRRLTWNPNYKGVDDWQLALKMKQESKKKEVPILNFKESFIAGLCDFDNIDDCIESWHCSPEDDQGLTEYLGLSNQEYEAYHPMRAADHILPCATP
ncbi:MAG: YodL domain-containing protein, partial [Ruminiclostridium sp.]